MEENGAGMGAGKLFAISFCRGSFRSRELRQVGSSSHCLPWCGATVLKEYGKMLLSVGLLGNLINVSN